LGAKKKRTKSVRARDERRNRKGARTGREGVFPRSSMSSHKKAQTNPKERTVADMIARRGGEVMECSKKKRGGNAIKKSTVIKSRRSRMRKVLIEH